MLSQSLQGLPSIIEEWGKRAKRMECHCYWPVDHIWWLMDLRQEKAVEGVLVWSSCYCEMVLILIGLFYVLHRFKRVNIY